MKLKIESVTKKYGKQYALKDVSCVFEEGVYGILGPNGAGKTTLISILIGILNTTSGIVSLDGINIKNLDTKYLDKIGYSPQYPVFYKHFTVVEFLKYMCALKGISKKRTPSRMEEVLELVNLMDAKRKKVGELSGGMRQRLSIAQAILNEPYILVLDEPTAGLDPGERIRFRNIISKLAAGRIVLITTHIISDIEYIANEVMILKEGHLVKKNKVETLLEDMKGKVWLIEIESDKISEWTTNYLVSNIKQERDKVTMRVMSNTKPCAQAKSVLPQLEDVLLDVFGIAGEAE